MPDIDTIIRDQHYQRVLAACPLLAGIPVGDYAEILLFLRARCVRLEKREVVQRLGEPFRYAGIVLSGGIEGSFISESDAKISMSRFGSGDFYGAALACLRPEESPIQIETLTESVILLLDITALHQPVESLAGAGYRLAMNLIHYLAEKNLYQNKKIHILSQKKLRDRILLFLESRPHDEDGGVLLKLTTTAIAEFLGVNRSALSRELGLMQDEGLLRIEGRRYYVRRDALS